MSNRLPIETTIEGKKLMDTFICRPSNGRYNLIFMKEVHKRNGDTVNEPGETLYGIDFNTVKNKVAHHLTIINFGEQNVSLKEYLQ